MSKISIESSGITSKDNFMKRVKNIKYFASLDRGKLTVKTPRELKLFATEKETISIVYPGKETSDWYEWDFRPIIKTETQTIKNLEFGEIWEILNNFLSSFSGENKNKQTKLLMRIFYKIAYLNSHINGEDFYRFDKSNLDKEEQSLFQSMIDCHDTNNSRMQVSFESFIIYNDLISANEDCKYFFREYTKNPINKKSQKVKNKTKFLNKENKNYLSEITSTDNENTTYITLNKLPSEILDYAEYEELAKRILWSNEIGRINTWKTYINILWHIYHGESPYKMLQDCIRKRGVFEIKVDEDLIRFLNSEV